MPTLPSIRTSIENNQSLVIDSFARHGIFRRDKRGRLVAYTGGFSVVYPFEYNNDVWAFRCWHADLGNLRGHFLTLSSALSKLNLPYFCIIRPISSCYFDNFSIRCISRKCNSISLNFFTKTLNLCYN